MKIIFSECPVDYSTYTFPYCVYALMEYGDIIDKVYENGFLPYSADITLKQNIFYLARSIRINLEMYKETTNEKRLDKKNNHLSLSLEYVKKETINLTDERIINFCLEFQNERFRNGEMTKERLLYIISRNNFNNVILVHSETLKKTLGYVFLCEGDNCLHYWYCYYDTSHLQTYLGKWIMWQSIKLAKQRGKSFVYLGTCYTKNSMYKCEFKGVEFWDGLNWNTNKDILWTLINNQLDDDKRVIIDSLKNKENGTLQTIFQF
jgi:arginyl-tRNA--protein-N-Asp/Glu arginylyltransferase